MIYIVLLFWVLMGLQAMAPYITMGAFAQFSVGWRIAAVLLFVILGPLFAIGATVNVILVYFSGDDEDGVP